MEWRYVQNRQTGFHVDDDYNNDTSEMSPEAYFS